MPESWNDLTKPVYQGHVVMPNPNSSGTGFLDVSSWLQLWGEEGGWQFMDALHENIAWYTHSGSKPCKQAAAGVRILHWLIANFIEKRTQKWRLSTEYGHYATTSSH